MSTKDTPDAFSRWTHDVHVAFWAGGGMAVVMGIGAFALGSFGGSESRAMVEAILPSTRFLCSATMTAAAAILALMLTVLGLTTSSEVELNSMFYKRIKQIAFYDMIVLCFAISFLVLQCIPVAESDEIPAWWYPSVYYGILAAAAILGGGMIAVVSMLYAAISSLIDVFGLEHGDHSILASDTGDRDEPEKVDA